MQLSGFGQTVGYLIAAIGPFLMGTIYEWTNEWSIAIAMFLVMSLMILIAGHFATTTAVIEDECIVIALGTETDSDFVPSAYFNGDEDCSNND